MDWHYETDSGRIGPVSEARLAELAARGEITAVTLIWREGLSEWRRFADMAHEIAGGKLHAGQPPSLPPLQVGVRSLGGGAWRAGKQLVLQPGAELPARCVKCDGPVPAADYLIKFTRQPILSKCLAAITAGLILLLFFNVVRPGLGVMLLVAGVVFVAQHLARHEATLRIGVCAAHQRRRRVILAWALAAVFGGFLLFLASTAVALAEYADYLLFAAVCVSLVALSVASYFDQVLTLRRRARARLWFRGCCKAYLERFPDWEAR